MSSSLSSLNNISSTTNHQKSLYPTKYDSNDVKQQSFLASNGAKRDVIDHQITKNIGSNHVNDFLDKTHTNVIEANKSGSNDFLKCFEEIRCALNSRERYIESQLSANFNAVFSCDNSKIIALISQLGDILKKESSLPAYAHKGPQNCPNSPSSQISSAGETDSGQVSPVSQIRQGNKSVAQVKENGIGIESDAFSVDELAEIQRNIMDQLKAKGIDPSILSDIAPTVRRRHGRNGTEHGENQQQPSNRANRRVQMDKKKGKDTHCQA